MEAAPGDTWRREDAIAAAAEGEERHPAEIIAVVVGGGRWLEVGGGGQCSAAFEESSDTYCLTVYIRGNVVSRLDEGAAGQVVTQPLTSLDDVRNFRVRKLDDFAFTVPSPPSPRRGAGCAPRVGTSLVN